jgi:hypothetical protein
MGDSHIDDYNPADKTVPCLFQVRNTAMLQPLNNWDNRQTSTLLGNESGLKSFLKNRPNDSFFCWPGAGIEIDNSVYIYCTSLKNQGSGAFGFAKAGNDFIAKLSVPEMKVTDYLSLPDFNDINFGIGYIRDKKSKWVYAYGQKYNAAKIECNLYVARFAAQEPMTNWEFWNGRSWSGDVKQAGAIATQTSVSGTFQVSKIKNKILLLSSALSINCDSGTEIYSSVSDAVSGPFSDKKQIYVIDDRLNGHSPFFYSGIAHPEYVNEKDEILVTYAINGYGTCVPDCLNNRLDPNVYRLRGIRVPYELLIH